MTEQSLQITFSNSDSSGSQACYKIEQEPWGSDVGKTTKMQAIVGIAAAVYGGAWPGVYCGGMNGVFVTKVNVYPCLDAPSHNFNISHGAVISRILEYKWREETVQCGLQLEHTTDYPVLGISIVSWIGQCYDSNGSYTIHPSVDVDGSDITIGGEVFGTLRIRYLVRRYVYTVSVSKRVLAVENKYEATAYVVWDGGVQWINVEAPADFEEFDGDCGNGAYYGDNRQDGYGDGQLSQTSICSPRYTKFPSAVEADREIEVEYCSQVVTSDETKEKVEYDTVREECS